MIFTLVARFMAIKPLTADRYGVTAVEYGIIAAFLCLSLLGIFSRFGTVLTGMFNSVSHGL